jgi:sugar lactone lactonase YvrE
MQPSTLPEVKLALDVRANLGEGPIWDARRQVLYWVDIHGFNLHIYDPAAKTDRVIHVGQHIGTVVPRRSGGVVVALREGIAALDLDTEQLTFLARPEHNKPTNRFNDGKCDPAGRFWAGTMSLNREQNAGSLWRLDPDLSCHRMVTGVTTSNGIVWSPDKKTMYYIDTPTGRVDAFDYDNDTGDIANRRPAITIALEDGRPDGMTTDAEGMLWVAHWDGGRVTRWDPLTGKLLQTIRVPASRTTACAFGGPNLTDLYITTARTGLTDEQLQHQPHAGGVFRVTTGAKGTESFEFLG